MRLLIDAEAAPTAPICTCCEGKVNNAVNQPVMHGMQINVINMSVRLFVHHGYGIAICLSD